MDNLENQPSPTPLQPDLDELQAQVGSLVSMLNSVLILVLVLGGALDLFLFRQVKNSRADVTNLRAFVGQAQRNAPAIDEFARKLADFGRRNPDFVPILAKYGIKPAALTNVAPPSSGTSAPPKATKK